MQNKKPPMLEVKNLSKYYISRYGVIKAVDDISFELQKGEVLGLIGQSGSGKSTTGNAIMKLLSDINGIIAVDGKVISGKLKKSNKKEFRKKVQMIFQNPHTALSGKRNIFSTLAEPLKVSGVLKKNANDFLMNWKTNTELFEYTFKLEYEKKEYNFLNKLIKHKSSMINKIQEELNDDNHTYSSLMSSYYNLKKDHYKWINTQLSTINEELIQLYIKGNNDILKNNISNWEKKLLKAKKNYNDLKNIDSRIKELKLSIIKEDSKEKLWKEEIDDNKRLLIALIKDRKQRINFHKQLSTKSLTYEEKTYHTKRIAKSKSEIEVIKKIIESKFILDFKMISEIDNLIFDAKTIKEIYIGKLNLIKKLENKNVLKKNDMKISKSKIERMEIDVNNLDPSEVLNKRILCDYKIMKLNKQTKAFKELKKEKLFLNIEDEQALEKLFFNESCLIDLVMRKQKIMFNFSKKRKEYLLKENRNRTAKINKQIIKLENIKKDKFFEKLSGEKIKLEEVKEKYSKWKNSLSKKMKNEISSLRNNIDDFKERDDFKEIQEKEKLLKDTFISKLDSKIQSLPKIQKKEIIARSNEESIKVEAYMKEKIYLAKALHKIKILLGLKTVPSYIRKIIVKRILLNRKIFRTLKEVGLKPEHAYRYPHEFSGGQLQRIVIAKALIVDPELIIADEPIASLDVSIQAQIINILTELIKKRNISLVFIAHDISVIEYIADTMVVMHLGKIVEKGRTELVFKNPVHPYTKSLFAAVPKLSNANEKFKTVNVDLDYLKEYRKDTPYMEKINKKGHFVLANKEQLKVWGENAKKKK